MSEIPAQSPLIQARRPSHSTADPASAGVWLRELAFLGYLNLRGDPADPAFLAAVKGVLGLELPLAPNTVAQGAGLTRLWLGPDEWLLLTPPGEQSALQWKLETALAGQHVAITDVSSGLTRVSVGGPRMREVLAKGMTLDLHPRAFQSGHCAQTLCAKAGVTVWLEEGALQLLVRRSFADYLWRWLEDAAWEVGFVVED